MCFRLVVPALIVIVCGQNKWYKMRKSGHRGLGRVQCVPRWRVKKTLPIVTRPSASTIVSIPPLADSKESR